MPRDAMKLSKARSRMFAAEIARRPSARARHRDAAARQMRNAGRQRRLLDRAKCLPAGARSRSGARVSEKATKAATLSKAPERPVDQRRQLQAEQRRRPEIREPQRPDGDDDVERPCIACRGRGSAAGRTRRASPSISPAMAPRALPRRQNRPPKKAGAICAIAAKDRSPICDKTRVARESEIAVAHQQQPQDGTRRTTRISAPRSRASIHARVE